MFKNWLVLLIFAVGMGIVCMIPGCETIEGMILPPDDPAQAVPSAASDPELSDEPSPVAGDALEQTLSGVGALLAPVTGGTSLAAAASLLYLRREIIKRRRLGQAVASIDDAPNSPRVLDQVASDDERSIIAELLAEARRRKVLKSS